MYVDPTFNQARLAAREAALAAAEADAEREHQANLARRGVIDKRKEAASEAANKKQREEEAARRLRQQQQIEAEARRLRDEARQRDLKRVRDEQQRIKRQEVEKQLNELKGGMKIDLEDIDIDTLDSNAIRNIKLSQLEKDKKKKDSIVATTAKRIDHLERAFRREELKHLDEDYQKQRDHDLEVYERNKTLQEEEALAKHKESISLKHRLSRLIGQYDSFKNDIAQRRHKEFEKLRQRADREFEEEKKKRVRTHMEQKAAAAKAAQEEERRRREEEERMEREAAEKAAAEEEKEKQRAERRAKAEADRAERDEAARKQREREEEAERRRAERKGASTTGRPNPFGRAEPAPLEERTASSGGPPKLNLAGKTGGGGWRERQAQKEAATASGETPEAAAPTAAPEPAPAAEPARRSGYLPPHLRGNAPKDGGEAPPPPANGPARSGYVPPHMRDGGRQPSRESDSPPPERKPAAGGRYVPPSMRNRG